MKSTLEMLVREINSACRSAVALISAAIAIDRRDGDRQLHDSDLIGEYNHRTGRLDAGNDPYGWYNED